MPTPVRFPGGVTNAARNSTLWSFGGPDPTKYHMWFNDFDDYLAAEWVRTATGAGTTVVNTGSDGGILLTTNAAADDDAVFYQMSENAAAGTAETFKFVSGKKLWFKSRWMVSDATQSDVVMGLQITDTTPLDVTDGVFFLKLDGSTTLNLLVEKDNVATTTAAATIASATMITTGFYFNGKDAIEVYINDAKVGTSAITTLPDDEELTISFGVQNGEAVAKTMSVDYIFVAKER